ncbi:hypothetical protein MIMGU_mgv1a015864mg [Erythranthe guttata]|uniref:VQ domain-containing protein n=1 Tax=Erythranthe guttata TaxID=4155 RepID=A0A022RSA8_ERYGU|nr:PREDICTED: sigma factor binding protein 1, chloroplastic-like [Erythranthe guttata]EYU42924.1 hypothetical protein MIMGU_mgv1a015864mg [Erythranthe guttata]|eukprot:XP_012830636.1 PREDICTED: sigma factor binding protein 1, chloroplastic-like [Erythranthe guttata]
MDQIKSQKKSVKRKNNNSLKVVYISSPMKVKTSASKFRSLVQQLTGKNSDISQYMEESNNINNEVFRDFCEIDRSLANDNDRMFSSISPSDETTTSSESLLGPFEDVFTSQMKEQFEGIFSSDSFYDPSQIDLLGSYEELIL